MQLPLQDRGSGGIWQCVMSEFIPTTDEMLEKARGDRNLRKKMVSEHLNHLMVAMGQVKGKAGTDPVISSNLQEGARLAVKLTEMLNAMSTKGVKPSR